MIPILPSYLAAAPDTAMFAGSRWTLRPPDLAGVKTALNRMIDRALETGKTRFISGMALGTDQLAAEIILDRGLPLVCAIPCSNQHDLWPKPEQDRYFELMGKSAKAVYISSEKYVEGCMSRRNIWMLVNSSLLIAVWDGKSPGTGSVIRAASRFGRKGGVYNVNTRQFSPVPLTAG